MSFETGALDLEVFPKGSHESRRLVVNPPPLSERGPMVSCLMVTRGNVDFIRTAIECFSHQTYNNKELLVVHDDSTLEPERMLGSIEGVRFIRINDKFPLGILRNIAVAYSRGEIICQWDDDDLYDQDRISVGVAALLGSDAAAMFLRRWLVWWPSRKLLTVSEERLWEGSMLVWRSCLPAYSAVSKGEDSLVADAIWRHQDICVLDWASLYCYTITGQNTFGTDHFEIVIDRSTRIFAGAEYEWMINSLSSRLPFSARLREFGAGPIVTEKESDSRKIRTTCVQKLRSISGFFAPSD
jgi:glycosyltransferase involved in cell wall biosynthesis